MSRSISFLSLLLLISCSQSYVPVQEKQDNPLIESSEAFNPTEAPQLDSLYYLGYWSGDMRFDGYHLPFGIDIGPSEIKLDNPAQAIKSLKADSFYFDTKVMMVQFGRQTFELIKESKSTLSMSFHDKNGKNTVTMTRSEPLHKQDRPQTPLPTDDYKEDSITFVNEIDNITLAGTLTTPLDGNPTSIAILLTGSGPQDRDETLFNHKSFAVIADRLTKAGLGVLRYDDRGVNLSKGSQYNSTSFDFSQDAAAAHQFIKSKYPNSKIGFIGHSEGGIIAQVADSLVSGADFHIYLAGPGLDVIDLMIEQNEKVLQDILQPEDLQKYIKGLKPIFQFITEDEELSIRQDSINRYAKQLYNSLDSAGAKKVAPSDAVFAMSMSSLLYNKWMTYFLSYKPEQYLSQVTCPILALNGSKDIQVLPSNLKAIKDKAASTDVTTIELENLNHLFQSCTRCTVAEYNMLVETFSPAALDTIEKWLRDKGFL